MNIELSESGGEKNKANDFWLKMSPAERDEIKEGITQLDNGRRVSFESVLKKINF